MGKDILKQIADSYGVTIADLVGKSREQRIVRPRHHAMWLIRQQTKLSYPQIGRMFHQDHTTVIAACRAYERRLSA